MAILKIFQKICQKNGGSDSQQRNITDNDIRRFARSGSDFHGITKPIDLQFYEIDQTPCTMFSVCFQSDETSVCENTPEAHNSSWRTRREVVSMPNIQKSQVTNLNFQQESDGTPNSVGIWPKLFANNSVPAMDAPCPLPYSPRIPTDTRHQENKSHSSQERRRSLPTRYGELISGREPQIPQMRRRCSLIGQVKTLPSGRHGNMLSVHMADLLSMQSTIGPNTPRRKSEILSLPTTNKTKYKIGSTPARTTNKLDQSDGSIMQAHTEVRPNSRNRVCFKAKPTVHTRYHRTVYCRAATVDSSGDMSMMDIYRELMAFKLTEMVVHEGSLNNTNRHLSKLKPSDRDSMLKELQNILIQFS